jgi:hypothetical protein
MAGLFLFFVIAVALFNMISAYVDSMFNIKN